MAVPSFSPYDGARVLVTGGPGFTVGGMEPVSLLEVATICQELAGKGAPVETVAWPPERKKIDIGCIYLDHERLTEAVGWEPKVTLRDGLSETLAFYLEHGEHYFT